MRKQKPLPKESSFGEFAANRTKNTRFKKDKKDKKPTVSAKIRSMFNDKDDKKSDGRGRRSDSRSDSKGTESRGRTSSRTDSRGSSSSGSYSRSKDSRGRTSSRTDSRGSDSRRPSFSRRDDKPDRRQSRGNSFKEDRRSAKRDSRHVVREFFDAVCAVCNKPCKVPFKPTTGKPISCSDCFEAGGHTTRDKGRSSSWDEVPKSMRGAERRKRDGERQSFSGRESSQRFANTNGGIKELFDAVCMKCGNKCKVPFKPTGKMGVSCSNCFDKNKAPGRDRKKSSDKRTGGKTHAQRINAGNKKAFGSRGQKPSRSTRTFNGR